jgi:hypothetical protein
MTLRFFSGVLLACIVLPVLVWGLGLGLTLVCVPLLGSAAVMARIRRSGDGGARLAPL